MEVTLVQVNERERVSGSILSSLIKFQHECEASTIAKSLTGI